MLKSIKANKSISISRNRLLLLHFISFLILANGIKSYQLSATTKKWSKPQLIRPHTQAKGMISTLTRQTNSRGNRVRMLDTATESNNSTKFVTPGVISDGPDDDVKNAIIITAVLLLSVIFIVFLILLILVCRGKLPEYGWEIKG